MDTDNYDGNLYLLGTRGYSAYEIAVQNGFVGTEEEWLESLKGEKGEPGTPFEDLTPEQKEEIRGPRGYSSYEIAVQNGFIGTEEEWVNSFLTPDGYYNKDEVDSFNSVQNIKINKKPYYYANVAAMKADTNLQNGDMAITLGYYSPNDGGQGEYLIRTKTNADADDGGLVIIFDNLVAELVIKDNTINVKQFGAKGDGLTDDTLNIQNAIDKVSSKLYFPEGTYLVNKNLNLNYTKHNEPCLLIDNKSNIEFFGNNAKIKTTVHAQGILEISNSSNITVHDILFEGCTSIPSIFANGTGEKGGYIYTNYGGWGSNKNNSVNTIGMPYADEMGTVTETFEGGYVGNIAYGILVYKNCSNIIIANNDVSNFNFSGISVGDYKTAITDEHNKDFDITIENNTIHDIYDNGINLVFCDNIKILNNTIFNIGHPDATSAMENTNPGYGLSCRLVEEDKYSPSNIIVKGNNIKNCVRKGIDAHSGNHLIVENNIIKNCFYAGIELADTNDLIYNAQIVNNKVEECGYGGSSNGGGISIAKNTLSIKNDEILIANNIITKCCKNLVHDCSIRVRYSNGTVVHNNIIKNFYEDNIDRANAIRVTYSKNTKIHDNMIDLQDETAIECCIDAVTNNDATEIYNNSFIINTELANNIINIEGDTNSSVYNNKAYITDAELDLSNKRPYRILDTTGFVYNNTVTGNTSFTESNISTSAKYIPELEYVNSHNFNLKVERGTTKVNYNIELSS